MIKKIISLFLVLITVLVCAVACADRPSNDGDGSGTDTSDTDSQTTDSSSGNVDTGIDYSGVNVSDYITSILYKELEIELEDENSSKEDALWEAILEQMDMSKYPQDKVDYYFRQSKDYYMYLARGDEKQYPLVLKHYGTSEEKMMEQARQLVKKDLAYLYIVREENIRLTDAEKTEHFDMYVDKYVNDYGYKRDYVLANMKHLIEESMLYDKTMEFLISKNTFEVKQTQPA